MRTAQKSAFFFRGIMRENGKADFYFSISASHLPIYNGLQRWNADLSAFLRFVANRYKTL